MEEKDVNQLKQIFVTKEECNGNMSDIEDKINTNNTRLAIIETYQKLTLWVLGAVGTGVVSLVLKVFVN